MKRSDGDAGLARKIADAHRQEGPAGVLRRAARSARARAFRTSCSTWFRRDLAGCRAALRDAAPCPGLQVEVNEDDRSRLVAWLHRHHEDFPWMVVADELDLAERDHHPYACFLLADRIVGYVKVGVNRTFVHDFGRTIRLPPHDCLVYDTFVLPEHRQRGIAYRGLLDAMASLEARGLQRIWCHIEQWNAPSLRLFRRAGFAEVAEIRFVRILGLPFFIRDARALSWTTNGLFHRPTR